MASSMISERGRLVLSSVAVGLATLGLMLATEPRLAIVWDEGYTLGREARLREWFRALRDPASFAAHWTPPALELVQQQVGAVPPRPDQIDTRSKLLFDTRVLAYFWPFAREEPHGHPPFYALLGLLGDVLAPTWQDLPRARLGPILLFSLTAAVLFSFMAVRWGLGAAVAAASAWVFQPNLFGHGHYAAYDAVLTSLWVLAIVAFARATSGEPSGGRDIVGWIAVLGFGLAVGCALATKLTGWFLPLPFLAWAALVRDRRAFRVLTIGLLVAGAVLFLLNPPWWTEPVAGVSRFLRSNLTRGKTIPIPVQFLGTVYQTPNESLPWYNTVVWTVMVTPVGFLVLALAGMIRVLGRWRTEPIGLLILANWILLVALRAMPHTPGHDGVRLFLPAFGVLALLVGIGANLLFERLGRLAMLAVGAALVEGVVSILLMMPVPLSYFSPIVGGLPGAARLGMEPTYYWDGLTDEARTWLRSHTGPGQTIEFATFPTSWLYLRQTGDLPRKVAPIDPGRPAWFVMQNRPGAWSESGRVRAERSKPAFTVRKLGVPLVWVFPYSGLQ
jgi:MFS family permease